MRLAAPRHARGLGARRRARGEARVRRRRRLGRPARRRRRSCWPRWSRSGSSRPGHPIYRQRRVGRDGEPFDLLKLRTMVTGAEHMGAGLAVNEGDTRITRVGAFLRRTSLDELPNLVNVLRGEMSIVGPRPTIPVQVDAVHRAPARPARGQAGHHRLGAGQRARVAAVGRAHRARPLVRRAPHRWRLDLEILARTARDARARRGPLQGGDRRLAGPYDAGRPADRRRASATTSSARSPSTRRWSPPTPTRSRRRSTRRTRARAVRASTTRATCPRWQALCDEHDVGAVVPLTDLDIEVLARARAEGRLPALRARPRDRGRDLRQVRDPPAARAPRPAVAADRPPGRASRRRTR